MRRVSPLLLLFATTTLWGCGATKPPTSLSAAGRITGRVHGGQQPVAGATIQLYSLSRAGDGAASIPLLQQPILTDAQGQFDVTGLYDCNSDPGSEVYVLATGGNPGTSAVNPNLALMTALGFCNSLTPTTYIAVNEVTTVAAVAALAPYMSSATAIGAGVSDDFDKDQAIQAAYALVDSTTGLAPGRSVPGGETVPVANLDTLADIVAACINTTGGVAGSNTPCGSLFSLTTPASGAAPTDTIAALIDLENHPTMNTSALFAMVPSDAPFQPTDSASPPDFGIRLMLVDNTRKELLVNPSTMSFTATQVGSVSGVQTVELRSQAYGTLSIQSIDITGDAAGDYLLMNGCGATIGPSGFCDLTIAAAPSATRSRNAYLRVVSSSPDSPQYVQLSSSGVAPAMSAPTLLASEFFAGNALSSRWVPVGGSWSENNGLVSSQTGLGWSNYILFNSYYAVDQRTEKITFTFGQADSVLGFGSARQIALTSGDSGTLSMFTVDGSQDTLNIMNGWTEGATPSVLASSPLSGGMVPGRPYELSVTVNDRQVVLSLTDEVTGAITRVAAGNNATSLGTNDLAGDWGSLTDYPAIVAVAGSFTVSSFQVYSNVSEPNVMFVGDSRVQGYYLTLQNTWPYLVGQKERSYVIAGRGGGVAAGTEAELESEVQYIKPEYLVVQTGTNDLFSGFSVADYAVHMQNIVSLANSYGVKVVLSTLAPAVLVDVSSYNSCLRSLATPLINFDLAMSLNGDGVTLDPSLTIDGVHPNIAGSAVMANRVILDQPNLSY